jgi:hypothetical protein
MAQENLDFNINVKTSGAEGSIGSLKKQLREAQNEVLSLSEKFGATSKEAVNAAKKAAELRDRIGDAKALTDAFNPDAKFKALTASLSGVAGGFGAVQGAMALFGSESENVQKTLLKVQSAMALSQGLQAVGESIDSFKQLGAVIRTQVVGAFSTLRGAIIATGVGALAVGLGLLIANFEQVKTTLLNLFPSLAEFGNKIKGIIQGITDWAGITSQAKRDTEDLTKGTNAYIKSLDRAIKELEAQGGKEDEIYKLKKDRIEKQISLIKGSSDEELQKKADLYSELKILETNYYNDKENAAIQAELERVESEIKIAYDGEIEKYEVLKKIREKLGKQEYIDNKKLKEGQKEQQKEDEKNEQDQIEENQKSVLGKFLIAKTESIQKGYELDKANADAAKILEDEKVKYKEDSANAIADITAGLSSIIGQETAVGKAIAISSATIDTYLSASTIFKQAAKNPISIANPAYPYLMAAPAVLAGIARVKQISSVNVPKGGGAGGGIPSMSGQAPMMPQIPTAQVTQLNQQSINDIGNQAVRAYVIESDVTSNQQRIAAIRQRARFS